MTTAHQTIYSTAQRRLTRGVLLLFVGSYVGGTFAAPTDISNLPLASNNPAQAKPNIMLLMDTSVSMGWTHMPDSVEGPASNIFGSPGVKQVGYKSSQCNALYYNPATVYDLPKQADGTFWTAPSFTAASYDPYDSASATVNLSTSFKAYDDKTLRAGPNGPGTSEFNDTPQPAYYFKYSGSQTTTPGSAPCTDGDTLEGLGAGTIAATGGGTWTKVIVGSTSGVNGTDERQNFANWYAFYRTRMNLTKSAASLAFNPLTDSFRVGFISVFPKSSKSDASVSSTKYVPIADFGATQRTTWYAKLFAQKPGGTSPTREGLARVGRHYAGKTDYINQGMPEDPMQYSCQQNFTILTTDGYWNDQDESVNGSGVKVGGPLNIAGSAWVGQQDGTLTPNPPYEWTPRPIWEGFADGTIVTTDKWNTFSSISCDSGWFNKSTVQRLKSTVQNLQTSSQTLQSTSQNLQSTTQDLASTSQLTRSTSQLRQSTSQVTQSTLQNLRSTSQLTRSTAQITQATSQLTQSTLQNLQSTSQLTQSTSQLTQGTSQLTQSTLQNLQSTSQLTQSTSQLTRSTSQVTQSTLQRLRSRSQLTLSTSQLTLSTSQLTQSTSQKMRSTSQLTQSTSQLTRSTSQLTQSTLQNLRSTSQLTQSTSQVTQSTSQALRSTSQIRWYNPATESVEPVASCPTGGTCQTVTTGPTAVASCSPAAASSSNSYTTTTCSSNTTGPTAVAACTPATASSGNNYTTTTCNTVTTGPTPVASCTAAAASSSNSYTTTTCNTVTTGPTAVATCTPAAASSGNSYTATTCSTNTTGPIGVASCTPVSAAAGNNYTATTCNTVTSGPTGVASCTPAAASSSNSYTATTCNTVTTGPTGVASCTAATASSGNNYTTTTCNTLTTGPTPVAACTPVSASSANSYTATTCTDNTTGPTPVASCTPVTAGAGNNYTATTCNTVTTGPTGVASCTPATASSSNSYTTTTCNTATTGPTGVASCTAATASSSNGYTTTTCNTVTSGPTPVSSCTAATASSSNSYTATTCTSNTTGPTPVASCTPISAAAGNNYTRTTCNTVTSGPTGVASCSAATASSSNSYTTTTCNTVTTGPTGVASCTPETASSSNSYTSRTCNTVTTGPTPVAICTAATASSSNGYTATTCSTNTTGPTGVAACTPAAAAAGNNFTATTCNTVTTPPTGVLTCTPVAASASNNYTAIICNTVNTGPTGVASCTPAAASSSNDYTTTTCNTLTSGPTPVATCTPATASSSNSYTATTCTSNSTGPTPVASCTPVTAVAGNNFTATNCNTVTTGPEGVPSCTPATASAGNNYTTTTCGNNNTGPTGVAACTPATASAGNAYTTTSCNTVNTAPTAVATCTPATASSSNSYTATTCSTNTTGPTPVASCTPVTAAAGNNYTATTCNTVTTGPTGVASCTPATASSSNSFTATTCDTAVSGPTGVASCTPATASSSNSYTATTCSTLTTGPTAVPSCVPVSATSGNSYTATSCNTIATGPTAVQTCTASGKTAANNYVATSCTTNNTGPTAVSACTPQTASAGNNWVGITCTQSTSTIAVPSCTPVAASAANNWQATTCPAPVVTTNVPSASCTDAIASAGNNWTQTSCSEITTPTELANSCTAGSSGAPNYIETFCTPVPGQKALYATTTTVTKTLTSGGTEVPGATPTVTTTNDAPAEVNGVCYVPGTPSGAFPALPSPNPVRAGVDISPWPNMGPMPGGGCTAWPCTESQLNAGGSINSLADVAQYYYVTDLRTTGAVAENNVLPVGGGPEDDRAKHQHMTTFTVALGVSGTLVYDDKYKTATTGDFADIRLGTKNWPLWPDPSKPGWISGSETFSSATKNSWEDPRSIDDFWHAAVNGRGQYFSAGNPKAVVSGLNGALSGIEASLAAGSAAGTSSQEPVAGDNFAYVASYQTKKWTGDLQSREITSLGGIGLTPVWSARAKLQESVGAACDNRKIYLIRAGASNNLTDFTWNTYGCDTSGSPTGTSSSGLNTSERAFFNSDTNVGLLSQYNAMTDGSNGSADQRTAAKGENLVNYLRGQRGKEDFDSGNINKLYRGRDAVLGDLVNSQPVYVKAPFAEYFDDGYSDFRDAKANRLPVVYVGGNDGMLHAFNAKGFTTDASNNRIVDPDGGKELWAIIPTSVLPNLYKLADNNYKNTHTYFVDATPVVGDVDVAAPAIPAPPATRPTWTPDWRTILVGGLNGGGKGFFALDVTNPESPKALWEFKLGACGVAGEDCHLGYSFGRPIITKLLDGRWVVMLTSGYNNVRSPNGTGDGLGYLYVLKADTGELLYKIATSEGDGGTPSGMVHVNNYVSNARFDNTTKRVYGADVSGNVWLFDVNDSFGTAGREAYLLGTTKTASGLQQPITIRPEIAEMGGKTWVYVGTGRLLGASDLDPALETTTRTQSVYGFVDLVTHPDTDDAADPSDPLTFPASSLHSVLKPLTISYSGANRVTAAAACDADATPKRCRGDYGWVLDLPDSGERVNVGMRVLGGTLVFASNVLESSACSIGGYGFVNYVNSLTGAAVTPGSTVESNTISTKIDNGLIVGLTSIWSLPPSPPVTGTPTGLITGMGSPVLNATTSGATAVQISPPLPAPPMKGKRISWRPLATP